MLLMPPAKSVGGVWIVGFGWPGEGVKDSVTRGMALPADDNKTDIGCLLHDFQKVSTGPSSCTIKSSSWL